MELFQELLITAGLSLLVAIAIAKLLALISNGENPLDPTVLRTDRDASAPDRSGSEEDRRFGSERTVETEFEEEEEGHVEERLGAVEEEKEAEESFMSSLEVMISGRDDVREGLDEERGTDVEVNEKVEEEKVEEETEIEEKVEKEMFDGEDEWEGIERSEWEERFRVAAAFVGAAENEALVSGLGNDLQMQLYGLHKVATEGTCYETQPLALKVAARAKWHAWQRLGNMNPELAMEQYITLLSDKFPGWMEEKCMGERKQEESSGVGEAGASGVSEPDVCSLVKEEPNSGNERKSEFQHHNEGGKMTGDSDSQEYAESGHMGHSDQSQ